MDSDSILFITLMIQNCFREGEQRQKQSSKGNQYCTKLPKGGWLLRT